MSFKRHIAPQISESSKNEFRQSNRGCPVAFGSQAVDDGIADSADDFQDCADGVNDIVHLVGNVLEAVSDAEEGVGQVPDPEAGHDDEDSGGALKLNPEDRFHCYQVQARSRGKLLG